MTQTLSRNRSIRLIPPGGAKNTEESAGRHLLAELWPEPVSAETREREARKTELARLLVVMRDEAQDVKTRIEAAEAALLVKDSLSITCVLADYSTWPDQSP